MPQDVNYSSTTPAADANNQLLKWRADAPSSDPTIVRNVAVEVPLATPSGAGHQAGLVPDPGAVAGTTKFLREDMTFQAPPSGGAMTLISEQLPNGVNSVTFSSISASFRDLRIVVRGRCDQAGAAFEEIRIQLNGDTGNNYDHQDAILNNATNSSSAGVALGYILLGWLPAATAPANASSAAEALLYDYRGTTFQKTALATGGLKDGATTAGLFKINSYGLWNNTAAINSVKVFLGAGNFLNGSVVSLYGIL